MHSSGRGSALLTQITCGRASIDGGDCHSSPCDAIPSLWPDGRVHAHFSLSD